MDYFCYVGGPIDQWICDKIHPLIRRVCSLTGRPSHYFAIPLYALGLGCIFSYYIPQIINAEGLPWLDGFMFCMWLFFGLLDGKNMIELLPTIQRQDMETLPPIEVVIRIYGLCNTRAVWVVLGVLGVIAPSLFSLGIFVMGVSIYFLLTGVPPGKSLWARAKDKVTFSLFPSMRPLPT